MSRQLNLPVYPANRRRAATDPAAAADAAAAAAAAKPPAKDTAATLATTAAAAKKTEVKVTVPAKETPAATATAAKAKATKAAAQPVVNSVAPVAATNLPTSLPVAVVPSSAVPIINTLPSTTPSVIPILTPKVSKISTSSHISTSASKHASASKANASAAAPSQASGAVSTGALVGGISGAILGIAVISFLITFYLRRWRKRRSADSFNSNSFRRSAVLLGDGGASAPDYFSHGNGGGLPRPPTLIANRLEMASANPSPVATYPYPIQYTTSIPRQQQQHQQHYVDQPPAFSYGQVAPTPYGQPLTDTNNAGFGTVNGGYLNVNHVSSYVESASHLRPEHNTPKAKRPTSTCTTVYNEEDAYGGI